MTVAQVEVHAEDLSMEALLRAVLPMVIGDLPFNVYPYRGKEDLLGKLPARLRGYAKWLPADWRIVVVVDRDDDACVELKQKLEAIAHGTGLGTRTSSPQSLSVVNRLAIEELEAWYFGDWAAVRAAYPRVAPTVPFQARYRDPDGILGGTWEAFERILKRAGYFKNGLRKIEAARMIGPRMDPAANTSASFAALRDALAEMC